MAKEAREEAVRNVALEYAKSHKKDKGKILDLLIAETGYSRKYLISKLHLSVKKYRGRNFDGSRSTKIKITHRKKGHGGRPKKYDETFKEALISVWKFFDRLCGERLIIIIRNNIDDIEKYKRFGINNEIKKKLLTLSSATCDRLLKAERQKYKLRGCSGTKGAGPSLNKVIPVKVSYDMEERNSAGIFEIDTVAHCGYGDQKNCLWTLTLTDVSNGFTFIRPLNGIDFRNKMTTDLRNILNKRIVE